MHYAWKVGLRYLRPRRRHFLISVLPGIATTGGVTKGVAYGPGRLLWVMGHGDELFDAKVHAVEATGITFAAPDGRKTAVRFAP